MTVHSQAQSSLSTRQIVRTWWPLAISWMVMTFEIPMLAAMVARRQDPQIHLAAWGIVFPMALMLASPIMMMLSASTALSKDWTSYVKLRRYMLVLAGALTAFHILLAYTPLFSLVVKRLIAAPAVVVEPTRLGLRIMLPWSLALAYRRFNYGVLIRFGHTGAVTIGSFVRLLTDATVLSILFWLDSLPGIAMAALAITAGVVGEAIYTKLRVHAVLRDELRPASPVKQQITLRRFLAFYIPLVMTSFLQILVQPLGSAALSRLPEPLASLAIWPVIYGVLIILMSAGLAYTEVVVVLLDEPNSLSRLRNFALSLGAIVTALLLLMNVTPLAEIWFSQVAALPAALVEPARRALWLGLFIPGFTVLESWFNGALLNSQRTRGITEAVAIGLTVVVAVLTLGVVTARLPGIYIGVAALALGSLSRSLWLWHRTRPAMHALLQRDMRSLLQPAKA